MNIRNALVTKYFVKEYESETELFEALNQYRIECSEKGISDTESVVKYLNGYEIVRLDKLLTSTNQTDEFKNWFSKILNCQYINKKFWKIKSDKDCEGNFLDNNDINNILWVFNVLVVLLTICGILPIWCIGIFVPILLYMLYNYLDN